MTQFPCEKPELFKGRHFNHLLIIQAVRWYVTDKLSYRDVYDMMAERGVTVVHRWMLCVLAATEADLPKPHGRFIAICARRLPAVTINAP